MIIVLYAEKRGECRMVITFMKMALPIGVNVGKTHVALDRYPNVLKEARSK